LQNAAHFVCIFLYRVQIFVRRFDTIK